MADMPFAGLDLTFLGMRLSGAIHKRNGHGTNGHFYLEKILVQVIIRRCMTRRKSGFFFTPSFIRSHLSSLPFSLFCRVKSFPELVFLGGVNPSFWHDWKISR